MLAEKARPFRPSELVLTQLRAQTLGIGIVPKHDDHPDQCGRDCVELVLVGSVIAALGILQQGGRGTIAVIALMISCHVSMDCSKKNEG
jgi:hypothetical protein